MITFFVPGTPATKGSYKGSVGRDGKVHLRNDNPREKAWRTAVAWSARVAMAGASPLTGATVVTLEFVMPRPEKPSYPHPTLGDIDKMERSCLDALTGVVYDDDRHVVRVVKDKWFADPGETPGCWFLVAPAGDRRRSLRPDAR